MNAKVTGEKLLDKGTFTVFNYNCIDYINYEEKRHLCGQGFQYYAQ